MHFHTVSEHRIILIRLYILCRSEFEDLVGLSQIETERNAEILKLKVLVMLKKKSEIEH